MAVKTTPEYWDCECRDNYIHPKSVRSCDRCGALVNEQPDSRISEVSDLKGDRRRKDTMFKDLKVGDSFDWIDDAKPGYNSFFLRCVKVSAQCYQDSEGYKHTVGNVHARVFHAK